MRKNLEKSRIMLIFASLIETKEHNHFSRFDFWLRVLLL